MDTLSTPDAEDVELYLHLYDLPADEVQGLIRWALNLAAAVPTREGRVFFASLAKLGVGELRRREEEPDAPGRPVAILIPASVGEHGQALLDGLQRAAHLPGRQRAADN